MGDFGRCSSRECREVSDLTEAANRSGTSARSNTPLGFLHILSIFKPICLVLSVRKTVGVLCRIYEWVLWFLNRCI